MISEKKLIFTGTSNCIKVLRTAELPQLLTKKSSKTGDEWGQVRQNHGLSTQSSAFAFSK